MKLQRESEIKRLQTDLASVIATSSADQFAMTSTIKALQTENAKLLDKKSIQQIQNDAIILNLKNELNKLKLKGHADDVVVINLSSPVRTSTQHHQNETHNTITCIAQPLKHDAIIPNNEFQILTHQSDVNGVEAIKLASPVRNLRTHQNAMPEEKVYLSKMMGCNN